MLVSCPRNPLIYLSLASARVLSPITPAVLASCARRRAAPARLLIARDASSIGATRA
jgi:hypothetical protein